MIVGFADQATADIYHGRATAKARRLLPPNLHDAARQKLDWLDAAQSLEDLATPPGNRLEALKGSGAGLWSIRINRQYRIVFEWIQGAGAGAGEVGILDYH